MLVDLALVAIGLAVLLGGAWVVVRAAVALALMIGLSRVVVGATVVAFGTSAPEFVVTVVAGSRDAAGVALGNVIGSNVANVALVLGIAALLYPMNVHLRLLRWEIPVLAVATVIVLLFGIDGEFAQWEGFVMFAMLLGFVGLSPRVFPEAAAAAEAEAEQRGPAPPRDRRALATQIALILAGVTGLAVGANLIVEGATSLGERLGMSEAAIGVSIIAVGTSLPEVSTSVVAALRREPEIAIANVVGSNVFNLLGVLGAAALIVPIEFSQDLYGFELIALALSTAILAPVAFSQQRITRVEGGFLLASYIAFLVIVLVR
jgi:cation:H+ antiporter